MSIAREAVEFILSSGFSGCSGFAPAKQTAKAAPTPTGDTGCSGFTDDAYTHVPEEKAPISEKLHPYRFLLKNGEGGGMLRTPAPSLADADAELRRRYGDRLLFVIAHK
jgi:hypothetical protein